MSNLILLMGLFGATLFGIIMYGSGGVDPASGITWVEYVVFGIIGISALPASKEFLEMQIEGFRQWKANRRRD